MDQVGTVRKEDHDDGFSLWLLLQDGNWTCVWSSSTGNVGRNLSCSWDEIVEFTVVVGLLPGCPDWVRVIGSGSTLLQKTEVEL